MAELADSWQDELIPILKEDLKDEVGEASVEARVVAASLRAVPDAVRAGVEGLFTMFACFAEDATVPVAFDLEDPFASDRMAPLPSRSASLPPRSAPLPSRPVPLPPRFCHLPPRSSL